MKTFFEKLRDKFYSFINYNKDQAVSGKKSHVGEVRTAEEPPESQQKVETHSPRKKYIQENKVRQEHPKAVVREPEKPSRKTSKTSYRKRENVSFINKDEKGEIQGKPDKMSKSHHWKKGKRFGKRKP